jgi:predicted DNA-binding transcriptional regulator YafY
MLSPYIIHLYQSIHNRSDFELRTRARNSGFGDSMIVLKPQRLRERIEKKLGLALNKYADGKNMRQ